MISGEPPEYEKANQVLSPQVALLPPIKNIQVERPKKGKRLHILSISLHYCITAKTGSIRPSYFEYSHTPEPGEPDHMSNPHWWRYRNKCCCHPKNTWHCCCHRRTYWDGFEEVPETEWYDCRGTGCLRCLLLLSMWYFAWPFVCIVLCVILCSYCCCGRCCCDDSY